MARETQGQQVERLDGEVRDLTSRLATVTEQRDAANRVADKRRQTIVGLEREVATLTSQERQLQSRLDREREEVAVLRQTNQRLTEEANSYRREATAAIFAQRQAEAEAAGLAEALKGEREAHAKALEAAITAALRDQD